MSRRDDWFRNKEWNDAIESRFFDRLARARTNRAVYLLTQAGDLVENHPKVALALLEKCFNDGENSALAFLYRARACLKLGRVDDCIRSLQEALQRERENPYSLTRAWSDYAVLIATQRRADLYDDALKVLREVQLRTPTVFLPEDQFLWYASHALIDAAEGRLESGTVYAQKALDAAAQQNTGLRYHPYFGLVGSKYGDLKLELQRLISPKPPWATWLRKLFKR